MHFQRNSCLFSCFEPIESCHCRSKAVNVCLYRLHNLHGLLHCGYKSINGNLTVFLTYIYNDFSVWLLSVVTSRTGSSCYCPVSSSWRGQFRFHVQANEGCWTGQQISSTQCRPSAPKAAVADGYYVSRLQNFTIWHHASSRGILCSGGHPLSGNSWINVSRGNGCDQTSALYQSAAIKSRLLSRYDRWLSERKFWLFQCSNVTKRRAKELVFFLALIGGSFTVTRFKPITSKPKSWIPRMYLPKVYKRRDVSCVPSRACPTWTVQVEMVSCYISPRRPYSNSVRQCPCVLQETFWCSVSIFTLKWKW